MVKGSAGVKSFGDKIEILVAQPLSLRSVEDLNDVLVLLDFADVAKARAWLGGADLKARGSVVRLISEICLCHR